MAQPTKTTAQPDHKNGHKPAPVVVQQSAGDFAGVAELPGEMVGAHGEGIQEQAARLNDARLQAVQRQKMATQIGKMQGNQHLQRVIQTATRSTARNGKTNGYATHSEPETDLTGDVDGLGGGPLAFAGSPPNGNGSSHPNGHVQREKTANANGTSGEATTDTPTEEQKAAALAAAKAAKAQAGQAQSNSNQEAGKSQAASDTHKQAKETAKTKAESAKAEAKNMANGAGGNAGASLKPGADTPNGAGVGTDIGGGEIAPEASGDKAPASPQDDPGFTAVVGKVKAVGANEKTHGAAKAKAEAAQGAAIPPAGEVTSKAQAGQVGAMEATETPAFDKAAFKAKLMQKIEASMPKTAEDADNFKDQGKANAIKGEMTGEVEQQKQASQGPLEEKANAAPDPSGIEPKAVTPMTPELPGEAPASVGAEAAVPKEKGRSELEAPMQRGSRAPDQKMAEVGVTEEQLANSNEPEFTGAVAAKNEAKTQAQQAPQEYRQFEGEQITKAKTEAEAVAQAKTQAMHGTRAGAFLGVEGQQTQAKSADEQKRAEVTTKIQGIYDTTKTKVEGILKQMDTDVNTTFEAGAATAKQSFENYIESETEAHKQERYGGWLGWAQWIKDKFKSDPEIDRIAERGKALFIKEMDAVINNVVEIVARGLTEAKAEISNGKKEIQAYVEKLPSDLKEVGQQAANDVQSKFEELESDVNNKQDELIESLSAKYKEKLDAVNARVEAIKESNKGLVDRAMDAIGGVIRTILQLKDMLLNVLARAAEAVGNIIKDPIGFLGNLLSAVKQGFNQFVANIGTHLKKGLISWLTGTIAGAGITLPESFDLKGIFQLVMQILGISFQQIMGKVSNVLGFDVMGVYDQIMQLVAIYQEQGLVGLAKYGLEKLIGQEGMAALMEVVKIFDVIKSGDLGQLWVIIQGHLDNLKEMVMSKIEEFIGERVVKAGITWLLSLFNPAGAFIKACKMIYDVVMFFVERGSQIMSLVNAIIDSVSAIASGSIGAAANYIEQSLAKAIPVAISFLSSLLGLGDISGKVKEIIQNVRTTVDGAIDGVLNSKPVQTVAGFIKKAIGQVKGFVAGGVEKVKGTVVAGVGKLLAFFGIKTTFSTSSGESHALYYEERGAEPVLMMASTPKPIQEFLDFYVDEYNITPNSDKGKKVAEIRAYIGSDIDPVIKQLKQAKKGSAQEQAIQKELLEKNVALSQHLRELLSRDKDVGKIINSYMLEGLTGTFSSMPKPTSDDMTADHQPQAAILEWAADEPYFGKTSNMTKRAEGRAAQGYAINLYSERHKAGRTFGGKGDQTKNAFISKAKGKTRGVPTNQEKRDEVVDLMKGELSADVGAMTSIASKGNMDAVWADIQALPISKKEKDDLIAQIRQHILSGEVQIANQPMDDLKK